MSFHKEKRSIRLSTIDNVRKEMAKVYRAAKNETLAISRAKDLTYILKTIFEIIKAQKDYEINDGSTPSISLAEIAKALRATDKNEESTS